MADPRPYERSYSFRAFPDDEQNKRNLGLLLDQQFDDVAGASAELTDKVNRGLIRQVLLSDDPGAPITFVDGVLTIPRGLPGAGVYETWLETHPGGTIDQFLVDMRAEATPELLAARDQAIAALAVAQAAARQAIAEREDAQAAAGQAAGDRAQTGADRAATEAARTAAEQAAAAARPYPSRADAEDATVPEAVGYVSVDGLLYRREPSVVTNPALVTNGGAAFWSPVGSVWTAHFGHIGTGADESGRVQSALDWVGALGGGVVFLSAPLALGATVLLPSRVTLENPYQYVTTMLPGCRTAYGNRINDALVTPCQSPVLSDPIIDGQNLPDAWHGIRFEGPYNARIIRPRIYNLTARASAEDGAGYLEPDGGNAAYAGYDDATAIFLTTYKATGGAMRRCAEWVIEQPDISNCCNGMIGTTHPDDSGSDGANFGLLTYPNMDALRTYGVSWRFGEQNVCLHGRIQSPYETVKALFHVGDTIATLINVGTDGVMFTAYVRLVDMTAGQSISQISVNGTDLLVVPVPFNMSLDQTIADLVAACQAGPAAAAFTFSHSARRPALWVYAASGAKLPTAATVIVVTTDASRVIASGPTVDTANVDYRGSGVTGLKDSNGFVEGHEGSDTIGILVTDQGGAEIINSAGNGPINRLWFAESVANLASGGSDAKARTNHLRAADGMTYFGSGLRVRPQPVSAPASEVYAQPVTAGDWSVDYTTRSLSVNPGIGYNTIALYLDFTPTYTTASGAIRIYLPEALRYVGQAGTMAFIDIYSIKTNSVPANVIGSPVLRLQPGAAYGEVVWRRTDGTHALWSVSHLTSGQNAQLRIFGQLPAA